jgi:molybdate transport system substrate-binding protein
MSAMRRASLVLGALAWMFAAGAVAGELTVLSAAAVQVPVTEAALQFTRDTGHRVAFEFATAGQVDERLAAGAHPGIVISSSGRIAAKTSGNAAGAASVRDLGTVRIGVAARKGAARPDLSSVAKFRETLVRAEAVAYGDPARGATTGIHFSRIVDQLDLRAVLAPKSILAANGLDVVRKVARGEAELGITQVSEILHVDAGTYVGQLPGALQLATTYAAWVPDPANANARLFVEAMTNWQGRDRFRAAGFD